jgi:hypothetical protein
MRVFVGTAQEYKEVAHLFAEEPSGTVNKGVAGPPGSGSPPPGSSSFEASQANFTLSPELIELALNRIPLSRKQSKVWRAIVDAYPNWITAAELAEQTGIERHQLSGVWGALGRRLANTPGWPADKWPIDEDWEDEDQMPRYRAHEVLSNLIKAGRIKLK